MYRLIALLIGYAIGCIQTAYFVGKLHGIDIREHGSNNAGTTNVVRTLGTRQGFIVFFADVLKAIASFFIAKFLFGDEYALYAGLGTVLGHCFPVLLRFRGGKGAASTLGILLVNDWRVAIICVAVGLVVVFASRYISLTSLIVSFMMPLVMIFFGHKIEQVILMSIISAVIWILHRENIKRLFMRTERKFSFKK